MDRRSFLLGATALGACAAPGLRASSNDALFIRASAIFTSPTATPIVDGAILVRGGRIASIGAHLEAPPGVRVIDARGGGVFAGFWNAHVHIFTHELLHAGRRSDAELSTQLDRLSNRWGFTSVFDVASILANTHNIRDRIRAGGVRGPNILSVGEPFFPLGGTPIYITDFLRAENLSFPEMASVEQAVAQAERQLAAGADGLKLFTGAIVGGPVGVLPMQIDMARAVTEVAHRAGKPVFAHPSNAAGLNVAIEAGVDVLTHPAPMAGALSPDIIARMRAANIAMTPTLELWEVEGRRFGVPPAAVEAEMRVAWRQLKDYSDAGGEILFGTDVGYTDATDTAREFTLLDMAGFDWRQKLAMLTTAPATRFGFGASKGRLAEGMDGDLTILYGDPRQDPSGFSRVWYTIRGGEIIYDHNA